MTLLGALVALLAAAVAVGAIAVRESRQAHRAGDAAIARGLASAATANVAIDPERSILLALEAVEHARTADRSTLHEAEEALHGAVSAARITWRATGTGGAVAWSPDGSHVITEGLESSGLIDVRDAATGEAVRSFAASDGEVTDVSHALTGTLLGTTSADGIAAVWDSTTGELLQRVGSGRRAGMGTLVQPGRATVCCGLASRRRRPRAHHARLDGRDRPRAPWDSGR